MSDTTTFNLLDRLTSRVDWEVIYRSEMPRVYNFFLYRTGERSLAEDLTATTFERAWQRRLLYSPRRATPAAWLFGIARNVWREHLRQHRRLASDLLEEVVPAPQNVERDWQEQEERQHLAGLLLTLPEREAELIALKYGAGMTNREIARLTGLSESNVGTILYRTISELKQKLEADDGR
jgi:RNA polymerase sigma-70 factor (ECF subfamily)